MNKDELRAQAIAHRDRIRRDSEDLENTVKLFQDNVELKKGNVVAAYWPTDHEFDVRYLIDDVLKRGFEIALPIVNRSGREMAFSRWNGKADLVKGRYGIFVPATEDIVEPDIVLVPMLAFDRKGNRLGRGGGHYDATLAALRKKRNILAIGVAYAAQAVLFNLPSEEHDQKMDMILTPVGVQDFRQ